jgi:ABC-type multidrug transport system fused ATPase/permease subunit
MNIIGKMFVILIFAMCIMIMVFAITIYATHTNWKNKAEALQKDNTELTLKIEQFVKLRDDTEKKLYTEIVRKTNAIATLQSQVNTLTKENEKLTDENNKLSQERQVNISAVVLSGQNMEKLRAELEGYRKDFREAQKKWADLYTTLVAKIDEAHSLAMDLASFKAIGIQLAKDYKDAVEVLKKHNLLPQPELYSGVPPQGVHGLITQVRPGGWVEISIGSDSGLQKGHQLDIIRMISGRAMLVGKISIDSLQPDKAVAVIMPEFRRSTVQVGDRVEVINVNELTAK